MAEQTVAQQKPDGSVDVPRVHTAALTAFIKRAFEAAGLPGSDADILAGLMVEAARPPGKRAVPPRGLQGESRLARQRSPGGDPPPALFPPAKGRRPQPAS